MEEAEDMFGFGVDQAFAFVSYRLEEWEEE